MQLSSLITTILIVWNSLAWYVYWVVFAKLYLAISSMISKVALQKVAKRDKVVAKSKIKEVS